MNTEFNISHVTSEALTATASVRRTFIKAASTTIVALGILSVTAGAAFAADSQKTLGALEGANNFFKSDKLTIHKVSFKNQYGMQVVGNLVSPKNLDRNNKAPSIIVGHPMGAVKEQSSMLYAQKLAEQGFVTLAIDLPYWGESEGNPRNLVAPEIYSEAFSAAVDYRHGHCNLY